MKSRVGAVVFRLLAAFILLFGAYYITLPPINLHAGSFWVFFFFAVAVAVITGTMIHRALRGENFGIAGVLLPRWARVLLTGSAICVLVLLLLLLASSKLFRAGTYSTQIVVREGNFAEEIPQTDYVSDIALMDSASARIVGARTLGTLSDLVSQYTVSDTYTQIAMAGEPVKVAPLEYASFVKWIKNSGSGIPGYVRVDPVSFEATFVRLDTYMHISPSARFQKNLLRTLRFAEPTAIYGSVYFEVDDAGHPYWIASVLEPQAGWFGAYDVAAVVVMDACTGEAHRYAVGEIPTWIDIVYTGDLICEKYDWYGMLRGGYWNSVFGQSNCVVTTDDFGYRIIGDDVYVYTGVTSVSNDEANVGFIMVNSRTGEYTYYAVPGAEEYSAMAAAEGSVQQFGYQASFPSLINVNGEATYIMVLKDAGGIVKMYAMVNVTNYGLVVTAETQTEVFRKYMDRLASGGILTDDTRWQREEIRVGEILYIQDGGDTIAYIRAADGSVYKLPFDETLLLLQPDDMVTVYYLEKKEITQLQKWERSRAS